MKSTCTPTSRWGTNRCHSGRIYRYRKNLARGGMRRKRTNDEWNSKCSGCAVTDGNFPGSVIPRTGEHDPHCEPSAPKKDVATIRHAVISTAGWSAGATPCARMFRVSWRGHGASVTRSPPPSEPLKRSAQNAAYRVRKKARADGVSGFVANYNSLEELAIPPA